MGPVHATSGSGKNESNIFEHLQTFLLKTKSKEQHNHSKPTSLNIDITECIWRDSHYPWTLLPKIAMRVYKVDSIVGREIMADDVPLESERSGASERSLKTEDQVFTCKFTGRQSTVSVGREKIDIVECADVKKPTKIAKSDHIILSDVLCAKVTGHSEVTLHVIQGTSKDKKLTLKQVKLSLNDNAQLEILEKKINDAI
ncbi:unnamed protein product, partial [Owenia fusiformis]